MIKWLRKSLHFTNSSNQNSDIRIRNNFKSFTYILPDVCDKCGFQILESTHQIVKVSGGDGNYYDKWFDFTPNLCNCEITKRDGKIHLNIFATTKKLMVEVNQGRNILPSDCDGLYGAFLKVRLLPTNDNIMKKTKTIESSTNPVWNETLTFKLKPEDIDRQLKIEVWVSKNKCIGSFSFDVLKLMESLTRGWFKVQPQEEENVDHDILEPEKNIPSSKSRETVIIQPLKSILRKDNSPPASKKKVTESPHLNFQVLKVIGEGAFGKVVLSRKRGTQELFAIKVIKKDRILRDDYVKYVLMEKRILALPRKSPFLVQLHSCYQSAHHLYFVMEYVGGGDLLFHLEQCGTFSEPTVRFYAAEIAIGLFFLHSRGVVYRDLKLENIMLNRDGHIKITDFGICKDNVFGNDTTNSQSGTPDYMAPEIVLLQPYGKSVDWWSYGIVIYEMLTGVVPFFCETIRDVFNSIVNNGVYYPNELSNQALSICQELLIKNPSKRLGSGPHGEEDIRGHRFFQEIDWKKIENRQVEPPFLPTIKNPNDVSNFSSEFTSEKIKKSPSEPISNEDQQKFMGFTCFNRNYNP